MGTALQKPKPLTPSQKRAAKAIGVGLTQKSVAQACGVSERTLGRWRERADFNALVEREADNMLAEHRRSLPLLLRAARSVVAGALKAGDVDVATKLLTSVGIGRFLTDKAQVEGAIVSGRDMPLINISFRGNGAEIETRPGDDAVVIDGESQPVVNGHE